MTTKIKRFLSSDWVLTLWLVKCSCSNSMALLIYSVDGSVDLSSPFASAVLGDRMTRASLEQSFNMSEPSSTSGEPVGKHVCVCVSCGRALKGLHWILRAKANQPITTKWICWPSEHVAHKTSGWDWGLPWIRSTRQSQMTLKNLTRAGAQIKQNIW